METYICYFDASCFRKISRHAFFIENNNRTIYKEVKETPCTNNNSFLAEAIALSNLLKYIWNNIEPKSRITICGDAMSVIDGIRTRRNPKLIDLSLKVDCLSNYYDLEIAFIPRKENYKADYLTRTNPIDIDSVDFDSISPNNQKIFLKKQELNLKDILIPKRIKGSKPNKNKYQNRLDYYCRNGCFKTPLRVNDEFNKFTLFDGFISYLIIKDLGIHTYPAEIYCVNECVV